MSQSSNADTVACVDTITEDDLLRLFTRDLGGSRRVACPALPGALFQVVPKPSVYCLLVTSPSLVRSATPHCTEAVVCRQKAVQTILRTIGQAFASIDGMLSRLVREGVLNAFAATLLPFFQDSYGSDVGAAAARPLRYCLS